MASRKISLNRLTCYQKANRGDYVDHLLLDLTLESESNGTSKKVGQPTSLLIGSPPTPFRPNVTLPFNEGSKIKVGLGSLGPFHYVDWQPEMTTFVYDESYSLNVTLTNVRNVKNPYVLAQALFLVGSAAAAAAAGYYASEAVGEFFAAQEASDALDITEKLVDGGIGSVAQEVLGALAGEVSDIFESWPECGGSVLDTRLTFTENDGLKTLRTNKPAALQRAGCNAPDYEIEFRVETMQSFGVRAEYDCTFRPETNVNLNTGEPWCRKYPDKVVPTKYGDVKGSENLSHVDIEIESLGRGAGLAVTVQERSRDMNTVVFERRVEGIVPSVEPTVRRKKEIALDHQHDTTTPPKQGKGWQFAQLPWWQVVEGLQGPLSPPIDSAVSVIRIPEYRIKLELYAWDCVAEGNREDSRVDYVVLYWRRPSELSQTATRATLRRKESAVK